MSPNLLLKIKMHGGEVNSIWNQIGLGSKFGSFENQLQQVPPMNHLPHNLRSYPLFHPLLEWYQAGFSKPQSGAN